MTSRRRPEHRKFHYIYKITRDDGKYYIGLHSTDDLDDGYFGSGERLWKSIKYHGKEKHAKTILEFFETRALLIQREKEIVTKQLLETDVNILNLVPGGSYFTRKPDKAEGSKKKSEALKAFYADEEKSEHVRHAVRIANKGKIISQAHKDILKDTCRQTVARLKETGEWQNVLEKNKKAHIGKIYTAETIAKRVAATAKTKQEKYGGKYIFSDEARINIGNSQRGNEKHAKMWEVTFLDGRMLIVKNIAKWYRETGFIHRRDGIALKHKDTQEIVGSRRQILT